MLTTFSCTCWLFIYLLCNNAYSCPLPILKLNYLFIYCLLLNCMSSLYILDINSLSDICFFSHSVHCLFILLIISFSVQKLFCYSLTCYFLFCCLCFKCHIKKIIAKSHFDELISFFYSRTFMVSTLF